MQWARRNRLYPRLWLTHTQHATINAVAQSLEPSVRHSFLLRTQRPLKLTTTSGYVSDQQVQEAIHTALREVEVAA